MLRILALSTLAMAFACQPAQAQWNNTTLKPRGAAAGASSHDAMPGLEYCDSPLGTIAVVEERDGDWYRYLTQDLRLPSTIPVLRLLIQQSNCFVVVERGRALRGLEQERALMASGQLRQGSRIGKGQMVAADFTINPVINFSKRDASGIRGLVTQIGKDLGSLATLAGGLRFHRAETMLVVLDNRSGVQLGIAQGRAAKVSFDLGGAVSGSGSFGSLGGYTSTPEGKVLATAFADSYNYLVRAMREYKAQEIAGGLGKGGRLKSGS